MKRPAAGDSPVVAGWASALLVGVGFAALVWLEVRRPLRRNVESKLRRNTRNLAVAALSAGALQLTERPVTRRLTALVRRRRWGLLNRISLPPWLEVATGLLMLDYTLYLWHVLVHKVPVLWRFHQVHHVDLDLDASTALRFHFGELIISVSWRAAQVVGLGISPATLSLWNNLMLLEIMFHHSNVEIPSRVERWLGCFIVTPRLHGIHHSIIHSQMASNWSSGLTVWDYLHRTLRRNVAQEQIIIGTITHRRPQQVTLEKIVTLPFR